MDESHNRDFIAFKRDENSHGPWDGLGGVEAMSLRFFKGYF